MMTVIGRRSRYRRTFGDKISVGEKSESGSVELSDRRFRTREDLSCTAQESTRRRPRFASHDCLVTTGFT